MRSESLIHPDWLQPDWDLRGVRAFMTTRAGGVSQGVHAGMNIGAAVGDDPEAVRRNREQVSQALGAPAVFLRQVHGARVHRLVAADLAAGAALPEADASIATEPGLGVAIQAADCLPVLFATAGGSGGVGGAHAGWRGLAAGVLENTVAALTEAASCEPGELQAWLGVCIGPRAFEVGADVLQAFGADPARPDPALFRYRPNAQGEPRWLADLPELARRRLRAAGVQRISGGGWCSYSEPSRFFSFRRERQAGRMVAVIALR